MSGTLAFAVPGRLASRTGGSIYDRRMVEGLRAEGHRVAVIELPGDWPWPDGAARSAAIAAFRALPDGARLVVDGLAFGALPGLAADVAGRLDLTALVHHPLADETGLAAEQAAVLADSEARALRRARRVVVTSPFTARRLRDAPYAVPAGRLRVVEPGVDAAPRARGSGGEEIVLLCAATLIPRKGHADLLRALGGLTDRRWRLVCAGKALDEETARELYALADSLGLADRIDWLGEIDEAAMAARYDRADLFVLASHYEGYGMAVVEAVARGLPVVCTTGGALADTLPAGAGLRVAPGDVAGLRAALAGLLDDPARRADLAAGARRAREGLADWTRAARQFAAALDLAAAETAR